MIAEHDEHSDGADFLEEAVEEVIHLWVGKGFSLARIIDADIERGLTSTFDEGEGTGIWEFVAKPDRRPQGMICDGDGAPLSTNMGKPHASGDAIIWGGGGPGDETEDVGDDLGGEVPHAKEDKVLQVMDGFRLDKRLAYLRGRLSGPLIPQPQQSLSIFDVVFECFLVRHGCQWICRPLAEIIRLMCSLCLSFIGS